ncbi:ATP-binding cassette domain-containing protein [Peribacillus glennii]|uniref:ATP-binding cassette domain-containing protein n=1 Tax=Peribacillus glennii TaxID=2303991 RepID=A0A372LA22_9BACI|nr:ATP-binding cassette domain-containing protein [Peribacillus glennii]RFU62176.1 ATP-binding cassette domain-containing protein [Peribacillus glennii]
MISHIPKVHIMLDDVQKSYNGRPVLSGVDLNIRFGEFVAIVGKSGCGKSTLLRLVAGLEQYDGGSITVNAKRLSCLNTDARIMFQDGRLLPWKRVLNNVGLGLKGKWRAEALQALANVGLRDRFDDWPGKLSGGQKQRVALARALVHKPDILLLDEPLGALDALTRIEMQALIERIWEEKKFTSLLVTHDVEEAVAIADRVILIDDGKIVLNKPIHLPRPRQRTQPAFANYVDQILDRIMGGQSHAAVTP